MTNENDRKTGCLIGLATVGCALTGIISLFAALSRLYWGGLVRGGSIPACSSPLIRDFGERDSPALGTVAAPGQNGIVWVADTLVRDHQPARKQELLPYLVVSQRFGLDVPVAPIPEPSRRGWA